MSKEHSNVGDGECLGQERIILGPHSKIALHYFCTIGA